MPNRLVLCCLLLAAQAVSSVLAQELEPPSREAMYKRFLNIRSLIKGGEVSPNWMGDGSTFWYRDESVDEPIFYIVDPIANTQEPVFDIERLRKSLSTQLGHKPRRLRLPFRNFTFVNSEKAIKFSTEGKAFILQLDSYEISPASKLPQSNKPRRSPRPKKLDSAETGYRGIEILSPDGNWFATLKDHNVWLRSTRDNTLLQLTTDGTPSDAYAHWPDYFSGEAKLLQFAWWSPDSSKLVVRKIKPGKSARHPLVNWQNPSDSVVMFPRSRADGPLVQTELIIIDVQSKQRHRIDSNLPDQIFDLRPGWLPDGSEFLFGRFNRSYRRRELLAADPKSGETRQILSGDTVGRNFAALRTGKHFICRSPRDGWNHLYLYDIRGTLLQKLTEGSWSVRKLITVDEQLGWVYFTAHSDASRPYDTHLCRVDLGGENFTQLTEETGVHEISFSPSKRFFLDRHSAPNRPPMATLRASNGKLLRTLSKANTDALTQIGWQPPEEFVVKAADGKTDLYGLLWKPYDFDPKKQYPVVEDIYGLLLPSVHYEWGSNFRARAMAQLGFVVIKVDSRGTNRRGRKFLKESLDGRHLVPDHVATLKQLAAKRPYMDLNRVGIYGHSFGGYSTLRALLSAPDVYHVGVAFAPLVDMQDLNFFGYYVGPYEQNKAAFDAASNSQVAGNLKGKLLIVHGAKDTITPIRYTMNLVNEFAKAGKPYDLIVLPEEGHSLGRSYPYAAKARRRYFQEHLKPVPTVEITRPPQGSFEPGNPVLLRAKASASAESRVLRVEFLVDGQRVATDTEPPYQAEWKWSKKGQHELIARVHDSSGRTEHSTRVPFYVGVHGIDRTISSSTDDVEEQEDGSIYLDSSDLELPRDGRRGLQVIGLRFDKIAVPQGAKITRAYVQFTAANVGKATTRLVIHANRSPNAPPFKNQNYNVTSRLKSDASVKWSPPAWALPSEQSKKQRTPDLSRIIEEIVSQEDWKTGNALALVISGRGYRNAVAYDGGPTSAPILHIEYEP